MQIGVSVISTAIAISIAIGAEDGPTGPLLQDIDLIFVSRINYLIDEFFLLFTARNIVFLILSINTANMSPSQLIPTLSNPNPTHSYPILSVSPSNPILSYPILPCRNPLSISSSLPIVGYRSVSLHSSVNVLFMMTISFSHNADGHQQRRYNVLVIEDNGSRPLFIPQNETTTRLMYTLCINL